MVWYNKVMRGDTEVFIEWLNKERNARYWTFNELARQAGLSSAAVSMVMSGQRNPGTDFCEGVARAFNLPPADVMRRAGILPQIPEEDAQFEVVRNLFNQLTSEDQERVVTILQGFVQYAQIKRQREQHAQGQAYRDNEREGGGA